MRDRKHGCYHDLETESPEARRERKWRAVKKLLDKAAGSSREFAARLDRAGLNPADVASPEDFARIPPLHKKEIINLQAEHGLEWMLSAPIGQLKRIYQSPGPIFDPEGRGKDYWGWAEAFYAAGFRAEDVVQMTFGYHLTPAGLMLEEPLREIGCAVIPAGPGQTDIQIELMTRLPVTGFVGMASYLKIIGEKAGASGVDLEKDINLQVAFVAAERLPESLRQSVEKMFGMVVRQGYGTADLGCVAYECQALTGMHLSSRCWVEICDPATGRPVPHGETGEVVVTPFAEPYPLIRLATGDLSRMIDDPCVCGRTAPRLAGILGRVDDTAKVKGQFIYPAQVAEVAAKFPQIEAWQVVISNPQGRDDIAVKMKLAGDLDVEDFQIAFQNRLKLKPRVIVLPEDDHLSPNTPLLDQRTFE